MEILPDCKLWNKHAVIVYVCFNGNCIFGVVEVKLLLFYIISHYNWVSLKG